MLVLSAKLYCFQSFHLLMGEKLILKRLQTMQSKYGSSNHLNIAELKVSLFTLKCCEVKNCLRE